MSKIHSGKTFSHTQEWKDNNSSIMTGRKITWADKISQSNKGAIRSEETKCKISLSKMGKKHRAGKFKYTKEQEVEIVQLHVSGLSVKEITIMYNFSLTTIRNILKRNRHAE